MLNAGACANCPAGKYSPAAGMTSCIYCPANTHTSNSNVGSYRLSDCTCNSGYSGPNGGPCSVTPCAAGKFRPAGSAAGCVACPEGKFAGANGCGICIAGKFTSTAGLTVCTACGAGTYAVAGASVCTQCPAGKFGKQVHSATDVTGQDAAEDCTNCMRGKFLGIAGAASDVCSACVAGTYTQNLGASTCTQCAAGRFSHVVGAHNENHDPCNECPPGQHSSTGSTTCAICEAGTYSLYWGASTCTQCSPGKYEMYSGSSQPCLDCNPGQYSSRAGASNCTNCEVGKFSPQIGAASESTCVPCDGAPAGSYTCETWIYGGDGIYYQPPPGGETASEDCPPAFFLSVDTDGSGCVNQTEWESEAVFLAPAPFAWFDSDANGCLNAAEFSTSMGPGCPGITLWKYAPDISSGSAPSSRTQHFVTLTVKLPYSNSEFTASKQTLYANAISSVAGVGRDKVEILSVTENRRQASSIDVKTRIYAADASSASAIKSSLGNGNALQSKIDSALIEQGLFSSLYVSKPEVDSVSASETESSPEPPLPSVEAPYDIPWTYVGAGVAALLLCCVFVVVVSLVCRRKVAKVSSEEKLESGQARKAEYMAAGAGMAGAGMAGANAGAWTGNQMVLDAEDVGDELVDPLIAASSSLTGADLAIPAEALELGAAIFENTFMADASSAMLDNILCAGQAVPAIGALFTVFVEMKRHLDRFVEFEEECKRLSIWCVSQIGTLGHLSRGANIDKSTARLLRAAIPPLLDLKALVTSRLEASKGFLGRMIAFWVSAEYLRKSDLAQKRVMAAIDALMTRVQVNTQVDVQNILKKCEMLPAMDKKLDVICRKVDQVLINQEKDSQQQQHFQEQQRLFQDEMLAQKAKKAKCDEVRERRNVNTDRYNILAEECTIMAELGRGANAIVFRAKWQGQDVAIKKIKMEGLSMNERNARQASFLTETDILIQLRHPNILTVYGVITEDPRSLQHVLELATHGDLREFLNVHATGDKEQPLKEFCDAQEPLSPLIQLDLAAQVARGMAACHKMECAHRDLKSLNVLASADASKPSTLILKISDFGESKDIGAQTAGTVKTLGTPAWTAPEVLRGEPETDLYVADVYSYGVILYEVATLRMPWDGLDGMQICMQLLMNKRLQIPDTTIPILQHVFGECLAEPAKRPTFNTIQGILDAAIFSEERRLAEEVQPQAVAKAADSIREKMIEDHEQMLQKQQNAQKVDMMRREEELQRKLRERKQNRGQNSTDVQLRSASDVMSANKLIPTLQHRPSMIIRKDMIDNHHQALQKEQTAQQEEIARAEEELQRQLQQRQEKRANLSTKNVCAVESQNADGLSEDVDLIAPPPPPPPPEDG